MAELSSEELQKLEDSINEHSDLLLKLTRDVFARGEDEGEMEVGPDVRVNSKDQRRDRGQRQPHV